MRNFLLLSLCLISVIVNGQIINKNNTWNDLEIELTACKGPACQNGARYTTHSYHIGTDTLINSKIYSVLIDTIYAYGSHYGDTVGFIREDIGTKKTYFISRHSKDEIVLYDFSLAMGDVANVKTYWGGSEYDTVTNIDSIVYMGQKRLTITLTNAYRSLDWIEGIGSKQGFLYINYYNGTLLCLTSNNELIYKNDAGYIDCILTIIDNLNTGNLVLIQSLQPNQATCIHWLA